jgi:hypothetical protein
MSKHLSYANLMATVALFVALGGSGYAAVRLAAGSVGSKQIRNGQVRGADLARNAVTSAKVKDGSLLAADFGAGQLPAGPAGAKGDTGPAGAKGDTGATGTPGPADAATVSGQTVTRIFATVAVAAAPVQIYSAQGLTLTFSCPTSSNDQVVANGPVGAAANLVFQANGQVGATQDRVEALGTASNEVLGSGNYGTVQAEYGTASGHAVTVTLGYDDANSGISTNCSVWGHATAG